MKTAFCLGLAAALTLTSAALAGDEGPGHRDRGARADTNGDGRVTLEESQAAMKARMARFDADRDGRITKAENARINFDAALAVQLNQDFAVATTLSLKYDNNPLPGVERTDIVTALNLVYTMD